MGPRRRLAWLTSFIIRHYYRGCYPRTCLVSVVGTSRCDVPARVQRAERISRDERTTADVAPLDAARTAQRATAVELSAMRFLLLPLPAWNKRGEGRGEGQLCDKRDPPLPGPLLPRREEREKTPCASPMRLIQWQWRAAPS